MATVDYNKYQKLILKYSYNGTVWTPVIPYQYRKGTVIEANSYDCGFIDPIYRWVDVTGEYYCINNSKYRKQRQQVSGDDGQTWEWVIPFNEQAGELIEADSYDCDYGVTWEVVPNEYICKRAFYESNYCDAGCPDENIIIPTYEDVAQYAVPDVIPGYPSADEINKPRCGVYMRQDGYLFTWNPDTGEIYWDGFLTNNNTWLSLVRERNNAYSWTSSTSYYNTNISLLGDWIYKRYTISSTIKQKYLYVIYKINIKTGIVDVIIDRITNYPLYDNNDINLPNGSSIEPFYRHGNALITDTKQYIFSDVGATYTIVTADLYSGNIQKIDLGIGTQWPGNNSYNFYSFNSFFPYTYYIFEDAYQSGSTTTGKKFGKIYKVNLLNENMTDFGLWMCDLDSINTNCGTNYSNRTGCVMKGTVGVGEIRLNIDTPTMIMSSNSLTAIHHDTIVISDFSCTVRTYNNGIVRNCNMFNPVYGWTIDSNNIRHMLKSQ